MPGGGGFKMNADGTVEGITTAPDCVGAFFYDRGMGKFVGIGATYGGGSAMEKKLPQSLLDGGKTASMLTYLAMLARGPLSPKLSVLWMILIAAMAPLIRNVDARKKALRDDASADDPSWKTHMAHFNLYKAIFLKWVLVPVTCAVIPVAFLVMILALVAALYMIELLPIWMLLASLVAARIPIESLWVYLGVKSSKKVDVDLEGYEERPIHAFILWMAEGSTFKYYFTCYLHVAGVVLQIFALHSSISAYGFSRSYVTGVIYQDFFGLSTYDVGVSFAGLDFAYWFQWDMSLDVDLSLNVDVLLTQIAKVTYSLGLISFVVEQVLGVVTEMNPSVCQAQDAREVTDVERGPAPQSVAFSPTQASCSSVI